MTLYEIDNQIKEFVDKMFESVDEDGEVQDINPEDLEALNEARGQKIENIALYIKNLDAEIKAIKEEEGNLKTRRIRLENKADGLRMLLTSSMRLNDEEKFNTARCSVSFRKSEAVIIDDLDLIDPEFKTEVIDVKVDKSSIKKMLKNGEDISGAHLEERQNIQIK